MYTLEFGLYPFAALLVGALLTAVYYAVLRFRCSAGWTVNYIFLALLVVTVSSMVSPVRWVDLETSVGMPADAEQAVLHTAEVVGQGSGVAPAPQVKTQEPVASYPQSVRPLLRNSAHLFGWLWLMGVAVVLGRMAWHGMGLYLLRRRQKLAGQVEGYNLYDVENMGACSFGRSVFIPRHQDAEMRHFMLQHELAHLRHHHFLWLCVAQVLTALNWYNPFCWMLFRELQLQQELQVDGDVLSKGIDRAAYQYSLLRASMLNSRAVWILSAFGRKPVTQRIAFMDRAITPRSSRRRAWLSVVLALIVCSLAVVVACQSNEKLKEHPLMGWWKMDFTRNTDSDTEMYPFGKQIAFYNYDTFLTITYHSRNGKSLSFSFSTEEMRLQGDTLVNALGHPVNYEFVGKNTFQDHWHKQPYQSTMPAGLDITDQWSRIAIDEELLELFQQFYHVDEVHAGKLNGVWLDETGTVEAPSDDRKEYLLVSDSLFLNLHFHRQEHETFRAAGNGYCGTLKVLGEYLQLGYMPPVTYSMPDADHLVVRNVENEQATPHVLHRIPMPADLKRMLSAPMTHEHN